jgi:ribonuclease BN (tRNA processing enzyme)
MEIRFLGAHNRETRTTSCICFLIDKTLAIDAGGMTSNLSIPAQKTLEAILITHQHYDHIRDIPGLALNLSIQGGSVQVYSTDDVLAAIEAHLLNGKVYPKFQELPAAKPTISLKVIKPYKSEMIDGHKVLPIPVNHGDITVGYQVSDKHGNNIFYTADTGPGLSECWKHISPQLLIVDVTLPNAYEEFARETGHLTPNLLKQELIIFRELKGYLPRVIAVHMDTGLEQEIEEEISAVARDLDISITMAHEGMQIQV